MHAAGAQCNAVHVARDMANVTVCNNLRRAVRPLVSLRHLAGTGCLQSDSTHMLYDGCWNDRRLSHAAASTSNGHRPPSIILGIESSCDDTGVAIVTSDGRILGEALATQAEVHAPWGGIVPTLAMEAHRAAIDATVHKALTQAGLTAEQLDAVAVTIGPGLSMCLRVGVVKAKELASLHQLPLIPIHHMEAHALVARLAAGSGVEFPFVCLLVSGGHNLLLVVEGVGRYTQLGTTIDDALGEAYDKVARLLGLSMDPSGGANLEALAVEGDPQRFGFVVPMRKRRNCDFSYAGLKTATRRAIEAEVPGEPSDANLQVRADVAASFQRVAVAHLAERSARGLLWARESHPGIRSLVVAGGVACNKVVRAALQGVAEAEGVALMCPPPRLCTDNGVMVAWAGHERLALGFAETPPPRGYLADDDAEWLDLRPRWPLTDVVHPAALMSERGLPAPRGVRKVRIHPSLTEVTLAAAAQARGDLISIRAV